MSVPTPAALKAQIDKKKALESSSTPISSPSPSETTKASDSSKPTKRDFVRPEHLTQRPLKSNEQLLALRDNLLKTTTDRRAKMQKRKQDREYTAKMVKRRKDAGRSNADIAKELHITESTVRFLLKPAVTKNTSKENN